MILVAIGANIPGDDGAGPKENCERALSLLEADGMTIVARSRWYRSSPWPRSDQPDYINGVVRIETYESPEALLLRLHAIEARMGRIRGAPNIARVIDLDLLAFDRLICEVQSEDNSTQLRLPHPRLHDRSFVLLPLSEVAPTWVHPASGRRVAEMIANLAESHNCHPIENSTNKKHKIL